MLDAPFHEHLRIPLARPWFDEREPEAALAVVRSGMLCQGERWPSSSAAEAFVIVRQLAGVA